MRLRLVCTLLLLGLIVPRAWGQGQLWNTNITLTGTLNAGTTTGTASAYVLTLNPPITAYTTNQCFTFLAHTATTGAATVNINGVGAKALKKYVSGTLADVAANDIGTGQQALVCYDGTNLQLVGTGGASGGGGVPTSRTLTIAGTTNEITSSAGAQDLSANRTWTLSLPALVSFAGKALLLPNGTTLPGTCSVGQLFFKTDATAGQNLYGCTATNTWTAQAGGGGGGSGDITDMGTCTTGACFTDAVPGAVLTYGPIAAPATPGSGKATVYVDSTSKNLAIKDDAGIVKHGVQTTTPTAGEWLAAINADGSPVKLAPTKADVGLSNVDNTSDATKNSAAVEVTNHRITPRVLTQADTSPITIASDLYDEVRIAELSQDTTFNAPSVTVGPREGQKLAVYLRVTTRRALTFVTTAGGFSAGGTIALPTTADPGVELLYLFRWNGNAWVIVASNQSTERGTTGQCLVSNGPNAEASWLPCPGGMAGTTGEVRLPMGAARLPSTNPAVIDGSENNVRLRFDDTTKECAWWTFRMPPDYTSTPVLKWQYSMTSDSNSTRSISLGISVAVVSTNDPVDANTRAYDTENFCDDAGVPGTLGGMREMTCLLTTVDSLAARDLVRLQVCREVSRAADTATGDMEGLAASLEYTR